MGVSSSAVSTIPLPVPNKAIADPNILPTQALHLEVIPMGPLVLVASSRKTPASRDPFDYEMLRMRHEGHPDRAKPGDSYIDFSIDSYALLSVCYPPPQTKKRHHPESCTIPFGPVRMERIVVMNEQSYIYSKWSSVHVSMLRLRRRRLRLEKGFAKALLLENRFIPLCLMHSC